MVLLGERYNHYQQMEVAAENTAEGQRSRKGLGAPHCGYSQQVAGRHSQDCSLAPGVEELGPDIDHIEDIEVEEHSLVGRS